MSDSDHLSRSRLLRSRKLLLIVVFGILGLIVFTLKLGSSQAYNPKDISSIERQKDQFSPRAYQFTGQGRVNAGSEDTWRIGGVPVITGDITKIEGSIHPGDQVSVVGHITRNGGWIAERIASISEEQTYFSFVGPLESITDSASQIAGISLAIDENTNLGDNLAIGELVLATFQVQPDNTWLALDIQSLSALEKARTPTITPTSTATPTPTVAPASSNGNKPSEKKPGKKGNEGKGKGKQGPKDHRGKGKHKH